MINSVETKPSSRHVGGKPVGLDAGASVWVGDQQAGSSSLAAVPLVEVHPTAGSIWAFGVHACVTVLR